jgi:hypothetical protein
MPNRQNRSLLTELVVVVLFFTLSLAVILQVFAKAEQLNRSAQIQNNALIQAESVAETLAVSDNAEQALLSLGFLREESAYTLTDAEGYRLQATVSRLTQPAGEWVTVDLKAYRQDQELFTLPVVRYREVTAS